jgi:hypothetical protein
MNRGGGERLCNLGGRRFTYEPVVESISDAVQRRSASVEVLVTSATTQWQSAGYVGHKD